MELFGHPVLLKSIRGDDRFFQKNGNWSPVLFRRPRLSSQFRFLVRDDHMPIRYLLLSETLLEFQKARKRTRTVSESLGNPMRVSDSNKYRILFLECTSLPTNILFMLSFTFISFDELFIFHKDQNSIL